MKTIVWCVFNPLGFDRIFSTEEKAHAWTQDQWRNNPDQLSESERMYIVKAVEVDK